ncbi:MAG: hypothetical protein ACWA5A_10325 [Marinibacterium sp.]
MYLKEMTLAMCILIGCSHVPGSTREALEALSPLDVDPAGFQVTLDLPAGIVLRSGSPLLVLTVRNRSSGAELREQAVLVRRGPQTYGLTADGADRLRALQSEARLWETEGRRGKGTLSLTLAACAADGGPFPDATVSAFLKTARDGRDLAIVEDLPVSRILANNPGPAPAPCR